MANNQGSDDRNMGDGGNRDRQRDFAGESDRGSQGNSGGRRSNRGFASMDRGKQREIASKGGKAAHAKGTAHEFDSGEAREAGRKGGVAVSRNREHMAMIGRRGGEARGHARTRGNNTASENAGESSRDESQQGDQSESSDNLSAQSNRGAISDREVGIHGAGAGPANGVNTQGNRGGTNNSLGGESRSGNVGAAEQSSNH